MNKRKLKHYLKCLLKVRDDIRKNGSDEYWTKAIVECEIFKTRDALALCKKK